MAEGLSACMQGDRRAGPSLAAFNYESKWGQVALKSTYRAIMEEEPLPVTPACCRPTPLQPQAMTVQHFLGQVNSCCMHAPLLPLIFGLVACSCCSYGIHASNKVSACRTAQTQSCRYRRFLCKAPFQAIKSGELLLHPVLCHVVTKLSLSRLFHAAFEGEHSVLCGCSKTHEPAGPAACQSWLRVSVSNAHPHSELVS